MVIEYGCYDEEWYMDPEKGGGWVKYEDYSNLELQLRDAEAEIKQLRNRISDIPKSERQE